MTASRCLATVFAVLISVSSAAWAETKVLTLKWSELGAAVADRDATVVLSSGVRITGAVTEVRPDALIMTIEKTSDRKAYAPGQASISKREVSEVRINRVKGPARLIGAAGAGAAASLGSLGWAISDSRVNVSDSNRLGQWAAITAGATAGGYLVGRLVDTKHTVIRIAPEN